MIDEERFIAAESKIVADLAESSDLDTPVTSCPGWSLRDLIFHLGEVQRFWAGNLLAKDPLTSTKQPVRFPTSDDHVATWMRDSTFTLLESLRAVGSGSPCWTWWDSPRTSDAVARHQVQEAAVHRWDAQSTTGKSSPLDQAIAVDGVAEFLDLMIEPETALLANRIKFVATDSRDEWTCGPDVPVAVTVRATSSDLVLLLYRRIVASDVTVEGDGNALDQFFTTFTSH